jgi:hypothetical protein
MTTGPESTLEAFVRYYLTEGVGVIPFVGYIPYAETVYAEQLEKVDTVVGSEG